MNEKEKIISAIRSAMEQTQEDLITQLDGILDNDYLDALCQTIVTNFKPIVTDLQQHDQVTI